MPSASPLPSGERHGAATNDPAAVLQGIRDAARATHVDFGFLVAQAAQESGLQADAKAQTSSAAGLFQFTQSTWLDMIRRHGARYGLADLASKVVTDANGRPAVSDPTLRARILDLRTDPRLSAALAGEFAKSNKDEVEHALGRPASRTDLSLAHFLGAGGATQLLKTIESNGDVPAVDILPEAAAANRAVFFDPSSGTPRTASELYRTFAARIERYGADRSKAAIGLQAVTDARATQSAAMPAWLPNATGANQKLLGAPSGGMLNALFTATLKMLMARGDAIASPDPTRPAAEPRHRPV
ncbi:MAG: hypothetical protein JO010_10965 [Alphaproteobacteria bacterium]|nr:hypothetical protein [Alphaproteobacteria bacterium]